MFVTWATAESNADTLLLAALELVFRGFENTLAGADLWHADIPPGIARGPGEGVRDDGQNRGAIGIPGPVDGRTKIGEAFDLSCERTHGFGVLGKVHRERLFDAAILDQIVEACAALAVLQAIDHGIAAIVADDQDDLVAGENSRIDIRIHHHIGAVTYHDDRNAGRVGHGRTPSGCNFIAHTGEAELAVKRIGLFDAPVLHDFAGQPAGGGDEIV